MKHLNFRIRRQRFILTKNTKYLRTFLYDSLTWGTYLDTIIPKPNRPIGLLSQILHYTPKYLLKTSYYSLFNSQLIYASQIWGQYKSDQLKKLSFGKRHLELSISFQMELLCRKYIKKFKILKLPNYISFQNTLPAKDFFDDKLIS